MTKIVQVMEKDKHLSESMKGVGGYKRFKAAVEIDIASISLGSERE